MDDDDLRRGKATTHIAFDEATAILAGDALQTLAFEILANSPGTDSQIVKSISCLTKASGGRGMVEGQMLDIQQVGNNIDLDKLRLMHRRKTGALISASVLLGGLSVTNPEPAQLNALEEYAEALGLAFQIRDDIIDQISSTEVLGKTQGADQALNKPNYIDLLGLDGATQELNSLHQSAKKSLMIFGERANTLHLISDFVVQRLH
jgi:geranylgeranyl diphosphate synthase type II